MRRLLPFLTVALLVGCTTPPPPLAVNPNPPVPALRVETMPAPPVSEEEQIWRPGYWDWDGSGGYSWREGMWVAKAGHGTQWLEGYWSRDTGIWTWVRAHWV